ncbi:protein maelstrom homolog [Mya arenaria]|nr:protein maelstrom homolog [Mya arenaria]XP_052778389.1 protein maelstrom homolog [Mya arenaria]XP_052778390.1 protein maelstrom homolog [Mya arenaria]XP_052778391.1 protein maelstrom homolog [Mya arenaria]
MPKSKKPVRNAFYFFMKELEPQLRREGRVLNGMQDVVPIAHPRWKQLPEKEKARFENMAKMEKARLRGRPGDAYRQDNQGNILAHRVDKHTDNEKRRLAEKKDMRKDWPPGKELKKLKFYFINFQILCKTEEGVVLPAEIAIIEFSLEKGITKELHRFIEPGQIPPGYRFTCIQNSDDTHQIPVENFEQADGNYTGLWIHIENFINPNGELSEHPPLYCLGAGENYDAVERCLEWIHGKARLGAPNRIRKVYEIEGLFQELHAHVGNQVSKALLIQSLTSSDWDYEPNTKCKYHDEKEVKDCSLGIVKRYAYAISDSLCKDYDVQLTRAHIPAREDTGRVTVLSPSSMPVCNKQEARLAPKNDTIFVAKKQIPETQDYTALRRPNNPQAANFLMGNSIQEDYAPRGRGLTVGMRDMSLQEPRPVGRGAAPSCHIAAPPTILQGNPGLPIQQPLGLGRGMIACPSLSQRMSQPPGMPAHQYYGGDDDDVDDMPQVAPVKLPSRIIPAVAIPANQTAKPISQNSNSGNVPRQSAVNGAGDDPFFGAVGVGRRGILELLMTQGRRAGVPVGRGYAPPDWVDDGSLGPIRRPDI